ncbi:preprotein translocase subunit SecE [Sporomusa malonica]|uniref:Protein translocase subunit SecE n=1 Tax=Sporomusa malonica TaxID=112901 RepID=A0A1W2F4D6_9FIRM|nr:preprotein translocase subunit SecE [Sporomusa malonica]SMD16388.1 preprotein translocase subunit SecE [Sporomusa malonica]
MAAQETAVQTNTSRWKKFLREVKAELKKVTWPGKSELISYTGIVFVTVAVVAALIWLIDASFTQMLKAIIK